MHTYRSYDEKTLKKLQRKEFEIFKKFDMLCAKYDIKYFAYAGTLLGAIRHKGFIPWDDDMDIGMLREEYDKFLAIPSSEYEGFGLYSPEKTPGGYYSFVTKFYDKQTKFITPISYNNTHKDMGIYIELFPFDGVSSDNKAVEQQVKKLRKIKNLYNCVSCKKIVVMDCGVKKVVKYLCKFAVKLFCKMFGQTSKKLCSKFINLTYNTLKTQMVRTLSDTGWTIERKWVEETTRVDFEDYTMSIPVGYKEALTAFYGKNYMQIPPEEKRWNKAPKMINYGDGVIVEFED